MTDMENKVNDFLTNYAASSIEPITDGSIFLSKWLLFYPDTSIKDRFTVVNIFMKLPKKTPEHLVECVHLLLKKSEPQKINNAHLTIVKELLDKTSFEECLKPNLLIRNESLDKILFDFFINNFDDDFVVNLKFETIKFLLINLGSMSEMQLFDMIVKWIKNNNTVNETQQQELLTNINFASMGAENLVKIVKPTGLLNDTNFINCITDSFDPIKNVSHRKNVIVPKHEVGLGYHTKTYPGFEIVKNSDLGNNFHAKFIREFNKYNGIVALENLSLQKLNGDNRKITTMEKNILTCSVGSHEYWRIYSRDKNEYLVDEICELSFRNDQKNPIGLLISNIKFDCSDTNSKIAFFQRI